MTPDPKQRLPRELLRELIEEGSEAFRGVLEKLINAAMHWNEKSFWESTLVETTPRVQGQDAVHSSGTAANPDPQVRHLDFYPRSLERGCRSEKALKLAIAEMYVMGV